jgi:hypothetical protein
MGPRILSFAAFATGLAVASAQAATAAAVYAGCVEPSAKVGGHAFYVDPLGGSASGDGSRAHPWRTLAEVEHDGLFATKPSILERATGGMAKANPGAPIQPGDTVYLLSGDHGAVTLQGFFGKTLVGYANNDFITIEAAPGQTPVLRKLQIIGGSKWVFRGLTFQNVNDTGKYARGGSAQADLYMVTLRGPHENIILDRNKFLSAPDVSKWSRMDWMRLRVSGVEDRDGTCVAITNNKMWNIGFGLATQRSHFVLVSGNSIDHFSDDGIDYGSSDTIIENNSITNSIEDEDGFHRDAMQGQPYDFNAVIENVTIRNNTVIRLLDPNLAWPGYLQGIDTFDGIWKNISIIGNTVVTDAAHGISFYGVHNLLIKNNILLSDSGKVLPCLNPLVDQCSTHDVVFDKRFIPSIRVLPSKSRSPSTAVEIVDNIATSITVDATTDGVNVSHNLCVLTDGKCPLGYPINGKMVWSGRPGPANDQNVIASFDAKGLFAAYDTVNLKYNFKLKRRNPAASR